MSNTTVRSEPKLVFVSNEDKNVLQARTSLSETQLDDLEVEFSKVEATLRALADDTDPGTAAAWVSQVEL